VSIINSPFIPFKLHKVRFRNFNSGRLVSWGRQFTSNFSFHMKNGHKSVSSMLKRKCHLNNSSFKYERREFGCIIALGWEVSRSPLTAGCANTQFAPAPWLPRAGRLKILCQWQVSKKACHGLLSLHALSLVIIEA